MSSASDQKSDHLNSTVSTLDKYIAFKEIKAIYRIKEKELEGISFVSQPNPRSKTAKPKQLYLKSQVIDLSKRLPKMREKAKKEHQKEMQRRKDQRDLDRIARAKEATEIVKKFKPPNLLIMRTGSLKLPHEIICRIFEMVCDEFDPDAFRLLRFVLEDLHNIALSCPDFLAALPHSYKYLANLASKRSPLPGVGRFDWDALISDSSKIKTEEMREACRFIGQLVSGNRDGLPCSFE